MDTLLRDLRDVIDKHGGDGFPIAQLESSMASRGKSLILGDEEIEDLLNMKYGRNRTFAVLAILFPHVNTRNVHHVDHVFPKALLHAKKLRAAGLSQSVIEDLQDKRDRLPNLQLLEGPENLAKSSTDPKSWIDANYPGAAGEAHMERHAVPWAPATVHEFDDFSLARREAMAARIRKSLGTTATVSDEPRVHAATEVMAPPVVSA